MINKTSITVVVVVLACWLGAQFVELHFRYKTAINRNQHVYLAMTKIDELKESIQADMDNSTSTNNLLTIIEVNRLEGEIRDLHMENAIDSAKSDSVTLYFLLIFVVCMFIQMDALQKKFKPNRASTE